MQEDVRIDEYIQKSADFAKPVLSHIRVLVHQACPGITETIKWGFPHFDYKGTVCSMASFKQHCTFGFWKSSLLPDRHNLLTKNSDGAMGQFGRITSLADLPGDDIIIEYIQNAVQLNKKGVKAKPKTQAPKNELFIPDYLVTILEQHPAVYDYFNKLSHSHKKEYLEWFNEAKTEQTRQKRIATALEWLAEGKSRNWKYERK